MQTSRERAHPRWRGADDWPVHLICVAPGSSPLARGGRDSSACCDWSPGLIPAGAGRTSLCVPRSSVSGAHPRWRGADLHPEGPVRCDGGSSPLARGGRTRSHRDHPRFGLIPAGAGRTASTRSARARSRAHPRWRGADAAPVTATVGDEGSSPLARGGTQRLRSVQTHCWAHPRWRGADHGQHVAFDTAAGSSPLARGGLQAALGDQGLRGLIPAGAGRTPTHAPTRSPPRAHPRWRGADPGGAAMAVAAGGSSPLARGGRRRVPRLPRRRGLIPAGAGRTATGSSGASRARAHPRWRGADGGDRGGLFDPSGSSPLARGGLRPARRDRGR